MFLTKCSGEIEERRNQGWLGSNRPALDFDEHEGKKVRGNVPKSSKTVCMVCIGLVINSNDDFQSQIQLQPSNMNVRHLEEQIDFNEILAGSVGIWSG